MSLYLLFVTTIWLHKVFGSIDTESWTKAVIPQDYWQPLYTSDGNAYGSKMACEVGCQLVGQACKAIVFDEARAKCTFGDIVPTWADNNYIPEYIKDGKEVIIRKRLIKRKALVGVGHLGYISLMDSNVINGYAPERPDLMPMFLPKLPVNNPFFGVNVYKNTIVLCGGKLPNNLGDKHCR